MVVSTPEIKDQIPLNDQSVSCALKQGIYSLRVSQWPGGVYMCVCSRALGENGMCALSTIT